ncbi:hypothetical protein R0381_000940 [Jeongeupia wiesaeckerbachi]
MASNGIVYFAPVPFSSYWQRPHYMMHYLLKRGHVTRVLWIDPYPTRLPRLSDLSVDFSSSADVSEPVDGISVLRPRALPLEPLTSINWLNYFLWRGTWREIQIALADESCCIGVGRPSILAAQAIKFAAQRGKSFLDIMDDFSEFYSGLSAKSMRQRELELIDVVDRVYVSAESLGHRVSQRQRQPVLLPNAYQMDRVKDLTSIERNHAVIGYVGTIADWFDWDIVCEMARAMPDKRVKIIGPLRTSIPNDLPNNVELHPECSLTQAIVETSRFGVGIIPFRRNKLTSSVDPIKFYEMRGLGVPIWSTAFGTMTERILNGEAYHMEPGSDWRGLFQKTIATGLTGKSLADFRKENDWDCRFGALDDFFLDLAD